jgi:hypothetical protein
MEKLLRRLKGSHQLTSLEKVLIIGRLEELEAAFFLINDIDMKVKCCNIIAEIEKAENLSKTKLVGILGVTPMLFYEMDLALRGKPSVNIENMVLRPDFIEIKKRVKILQNYFLENI